MLKRLDTPVLLIGFNRPDLTRKVLNQISLVQPKELFFAVDGPRRKSDRAHVIAVRKTIKLIDWPCTVKTNFSPKNYGCKLGPVRAMNWFFSQVNQGIILEDDVFPDKSFFWFCEELLKKYQNNYQIGSISGNNFSPISDRHSSYTFSRYTQTWGWATWRRAWQKYDINILGWPEKRKSSWLRSILKSPLNVMYWKLVYDSVYSGDLSTVWDYQWTYACWNNKLLTVIPNQNLAINIGIGIPGATHTVLNNRLSHYSIEEIGLPLRHPNTVFPNPDFDKYIQKHNYVLWKELLMKLLRRISLINREIRSKVN
jgi:hypothetical protein